MLNFIFNIRDNNLIHIKISLYLIIVEKYRHSRLWRKHFITKNRVYRERNAQMAIDMLEHWNWYLYTQYCIGWPVIMICSFYGYITSYFIKSSNLAPMEWRVFDLTCVKKKRENNLISMYLPFPRKKKKKKTLK